jgi:hypothetical protein
MGFINCACAIVLPVKQHRQSIVLVQDIGLENSSASTVSVRGVPYYWNVGLDQGCEPISIIVCKGKIMGDLCGMRTFKKNGIHITF